ncbi:MAG: hypothetical protein WBA41_31960 [Rivularia sp. (in: cyanobacteria)]
MSHQFGFLQVFAGYNSAQCLLLSIFSVKKRIEILPAASLRRFWQFEMMLLAGMNRFHGQIRLKLAFFQQKSLYWDALARATLPYKWYQPLTGRFKMLRSLYIRRLKKMLASFSSNWDLQPNKSLNIFSHLNSYRLTIKATEV